MVRKMVVLQFCTVGLIILLNSFSDRSIFQKFINLNSGRKRQYVEFSVEWYKDAGLTITLTLALLIFSPHLANGSLLILRYLRQFYDQRFTCDGR